MAKLIKVLTVEVEVPDDDDAVTEAVENGNVREGLLPLMLSRTSGEGVTERFFVEDTADGDRREFTIWSRS